MRVQRRAQAASRSRPITRTATEARQGEIILGRWGRWLWIAAFVVMALFAIYGLWR